MCLETPMIKATIYLNILTSVLKSCWSCQQGANTSLMTRVLGSSEAFVRDAHVWSSMPWRTLKEWQRKHRKISRRNKHIVSWVISLFSCTRWHMQQTNDNRQNTSNAENAVSHFMASQSKRGNLPRGEISTLTQMGRTEIVKTKFSSISASTGV